MALSSNGEEKIRNLIHLIFRGMSVETLPRQVRCSTKVHQVDKVLKPGRLDAPTKLMDLSQAIDLLPVFQVLDNAYLLGYCNNRIFLYLIPLEHGKHRNDWFPSWRHRLHPHYR